MKGDQMGRMPPGVEPNHRRNHRSFLGRLAHLLFGRPASFTELVLSFCLWTMAGAGAYAFGEALRAIVPNHDRLTALLAALLGSTPVWCGIAYWLGYRSGRS